MMGPQHQQRVRFGPRSSSGLGNLRFVSVNTWIILINVAVFLLNNVAFQNTKTTVSAGTDYIRGVKQEQIDRAVVNRQGATLDKDGTFHCPIYDPKSGRLDPFGRPVALQIGTERFRVQPVVEAWGHFSTWKFWKEGELWRLITFQFLHFDQWHLLFNMLGLWFIGGLVEQYLGRRRYAVFYLVCGVCGALTYMALNLIGATLLSAGVRIGIPFVLFDDPYTPLIGASAGVFGVLLAGAFIAPSAIVLIMFVLPMKLRTAVYVFLGLAIYNLYAGGHNAGGDAAHVGGALAGAYLIRRPYILRDLVTCFGLFKGSGKPDSSEVRRANPYEAFDRIIEKARVEGSESLSDSERTVVRRMMESQSSQPREDPYY